MTKINNQYIGYDNNGNIETDGLHSYTYDVRNRMSSIDGNTFFSYNTINQRVKSGPSGTTLYAWANDRIIGEYTGGGQARNETLYLGNTPVGIIKSGTRYRVYADQVDTPRLTTTQGNTTVWRWKSKPFGESQPNQDVDGNGNNFVYNLRFPGQYYDAETKTHYNYRRDYNPKTGRYIQSDPIGIDGGIGTYSYVNNSPLMGRDPLGLADCSCNPPVGGGVRVGIEKICKYSCLCSECGGDDKFFTIEYSAGTSGSALCIGQATDVFTGITTLNTIKFDTNSFFDRVLNIEVPNDFMDKIDEKCEDC